MMQYGTAVTAVTVCQLLSRMEWLRCQPPSYFQVSFPCLYMPFLHCCNIFAHMNKPVVGTLENGSGRTLAMRMMNKEGGRVVVHVLSCVCACVCECAMDF